MLDYTPAAQTNVYLILFTDLNRTLLDFRFRVMCDPGESYRDRLGSDIAKHSVSSGRISKLENNTVGSGRFGAVRNSHFLLRFDSVRFRVQVRFDSVSQKSNQTVRR